MHIERLDRNKLRILLSDMDFEDFSVSKKELATNRGVLRSFILKLMDTISEETDFNPYNGNIVIEAKESDEGMSITISKSVLKRKYTKEELKNARHIKATPKNKTGVKKKEIFNIYKFSDFEDLCRALAMMDNFIHQDSMLYNYNGTYCYMLMINDRFLQYEKLLGKNLNILNEYSNSSHTSSISTNHIKEHGELVCAGEKLVSMAEGIRNINIL